MTDERPLRVLYITKAIGSGLYGVSAVLMQMVLDRDASITCQVGAGVVRDLPESLKPLVSRLPFSSPILRGWTPTQTTEIRKLIWGFRPDIVHIHGVFWHLQNAAVMIARELGIPVMLSTHGMLEPWLWSQKGSFYRFAKRLFWRIAFLPFLKNVNTLHAITDGEVNTLQQEFPGIPCICIPNTLDLTVPDRLVSRQVSPERFFLFLSRIHPKKGVELLVEAFIRSGVGSNFKLVIAGPEEDAEYARRLKERVQQAGCGEIVSFLGPINDHDKFGLMARAWALVLSSFSEVVGMVNLEAAAVYTPSITTYQTGLLDWQEGGGLLVHPDVPELSDALQKAAGWSPEERLTRGMRSRQLVERRYNWKIAAGQWTGIYKNIAGRGQRSEG